MEVGPSGRPAGGERASPPNSTGKSREIESWEVGGFSHPPSNPSDYRNGWHLLIAREQCSRIVAFIVLRGEEVGTVLEEDYEGG